MEGKVCPVSSVVEHCTYGLPNDGEMRDAVVASSTLARGTLFAGRYIQRHVSLSKLCIQLIAVTERYPILDFGGVGTTRSSNKALINKQYHHILFALLPSASADLHAPFAPESLHYVQRPFCSLVIVFRFDQVSSSLG